MIRGIVRQVYPGGNVMVEQTDPPVRESTRPISAEIVDGPIAVGDEVVLSLRRATNPPPESISELAGRIRSISDDERMIGHSRQLDNLARLGYELAGLVLAGER